MTDKFLDKPPIDFDQFREDLMGRRLKEKGGLRKSFKIPREYEKEKAGLQILAETDDLTGLHNRRRFNEELRDAVSLFNRYGQEFSLINLDLKKFKGINDTYGHPEGDICLIYFADFFKNNIREGDMVFRVGGDEFFLLLPRMDAIEAKDMYKRLLKGFNNQKNQLEEGRVEKLVEINHSIKQWSKDDNINAFLRDLDKKMYAEKRS